MVSNKTSKTVEKRIEKSEKYFGLGKNISISINDLSEVRKLKYSRLADF